MDLPIAPSSDDEALAAARCAGTAGAARRASGLRLRAFRARVSAGFLAAARLDALALRSSEDGFVDELFAAAPALGAPLLAATFPRAFCDANREPWEARSGHVRGAAAALGEHHQCPDRVPVSGRSPAWWRRARRSIGGKLPFAEAERRVRCIWQPFHKALRELVDAHPAAVRRPACWWIAIPCRATAPRADGADRLRAGRCARHHLLAAR